LATNVTEGIRNTTASDSNDLDRIRLPRVIEPDHILRPYSFREALGQKLLKEMQSGKFSNETYKAHIDVPPSNIIVFLTTDKIICADSKQFKVQWKVLVKNVKASRKLENSIELEVQNQESNLYIIPISTHDSRVKELCDDIDEMIRENIDINLDEKINDKEKEKYQSYFLDPYWARMIPPYGDKIDFSNIHLRSTGSPISLIDLAKLEYSESQRKYELQQQKIQSTIPFYPVPSYPLSPDPYLFVRDPLISKLMPAFTEKVNFQDQLSRLKHVDIDNTRYIIPDNFEALIPNLGHLPNIMGHIPSNLGHLPSNLGHIPSNLGHIHSNLGEIPNNLEIPNSLGELDFPLNLNLQGEVPIEIGTNNVVVTDPYELFQFSTSYLNDTELMEIYTQ